MLIERYLTSSKNLTGIFAKMAEGTAPQKFNREHLAGIGYSGSNDRAVIPLLKDLGFLSSDGTPTARYLEYRDKSRSRVVLGKALLEAYQDLFTINENPGEKDRNAIEGKFRSVHNSTDRVAKEQAATFYALLKLADLQGAREGRSSPQTAPAESEERSERDPSGSVPVVPSRPLSSLNLRYNIEIHLPPTKDVEVYNAIFKALKEHLLVD